MWVKSIDWSVVVNVYHSIINLKFPKKKKKIITLKEAHEILLVVYFGNRLKVIFSKIQHHLDFTIEILENSHNFLVSTLLELHLKA